MKRFIQNIVLAALISLTAFMSTSCNDYLNIKPQGEKIPTTLADYEALLRMHEITMKAAIDQAILLLNDYQPSVSDMQWYPLWGANFYWDQSADRISLNNDEEELYYMSYYTIGICNLLLQDIPGATECTEEEKTEVMAYCKAISAMTYFILVNYYAETYDEGTASEKLGVPLITSPEVGAPSEQVSIARMYDYIITMTKEAIENLPKESMTPIHPNLGSAYAFLSRVYLQMSNYTEALTYADLALGENDALYDWVSFYYDNQETIDNPDDYLDLDSPMGLDYCENYNFRHGGIAYDNNDYNMPVMRAERFEKGDAHFLAGWKYYQDPMDSYYKSTLFGYFNHGGMTTVEVYLIKAECLARTGKIQEAMDILNRVRETRILPDIYQPLTASSMKEAVSYIRVTKENELIYTISSFGDARRLNLEPNFARTFTKEVNGEAVSLTPDSYLWTMPFPGGAVSKPGNGTLVQNVER